MLDNRHHTMTDYDPWSRAGTCYDSGIGMSGSHILRNGIFMQNKNSEFCAPLTSFDWNETDPKRLGTSSIDTTCTIWDIEVSWCRDQPIAEDTKLPLVMERFGVIIFVGERTRRNQFAKRDFALVWSFSATLQATAKGKIRYYGEFSVTSLGLLPSFLAVTSLQSWLRGWTLIRAARSCRYSADCTWQRSLWHCLGRHWRLCIRICRWICACLWSQVSLTRWAWPWPYNSGVAFFLRRDVI